MFPLPGATAPPSLTGGTAGPSSSGDAGSAMFGATGGMGPVVVGGFKSDGSAAVAALPGWFLPAALAGLAFVGWAALRRR